VAPEPLFSTPCNRFNLRQNVSSRFSRLTSSTPIADHVTQDPLCLLDLTNRYEFFRRVGETDITRAEANCGDSRRVEKRSICPRR
jgi:hypothetical protein